MGRKTDNAYKTENDIFATRLRGLMEKKGLTQQSLAELTGFQRQTIGQYVNGTSKPDTYRLIKIAKALDVTPNLLLGFSTAETDNPSVAAIVDYTGLDAECIHAIHQARGSLAVDFLNYCLRKASNYDTITKLIQKNIRAEAKALLYHDESITPTEENETTVVLNPDEASRWFISLFNDEIRSIATFSLNCVLYANNRLSDEAHNILIEEEQEMLSEMSADDRKLFELARKRTKEKRAAHEDP